MKRLDVSGEETDDTAKYSYGGKELDGGTNLYYFNARYYDATIGRFINVDPVQDGGNWYVYCGNNPLLLIDPTGLENRHINVMRKEVYTISPLQHYEYLTTGPRDYPNSVDKAIVFSKALAKEITSWIKASPPVSLCFQLFKSVDRWIGVSNTLLNDEGKEQNLNGKMGNSVIELIKKDSDIVNKPMWKLTRFTSENYSYLVIGTDLQTTTYKEKYHWYRLDFLDLEGNVIEGASIDIDFSLTDEIDNLVATGDKILEESEFVRTTYDNNYQKIKSVYYNYGELKR